MEHAMVKEFYIIPMDFVIKASLKITWDMDQAYFASI
jgi:hypothetical protein